MIVSSLALPIPLVLFGCLGVGAIILYLSRRRLPPLPLWLNSVTAYFLGQGILSSAFIFLGLAGFFSRETLLGILIPSATAGVGYLCITATEWRVSIREAFYAWRNAPLAWQAISLFLILLLGFGVTSLGGWVVVDAIAFSLPVAKVMAASHRLFPLPGYEAFCSVGLLGEALLAALFSLGMPNISPRIFSWANFIPTLGIIYGLARQCQMSRRGGLLAVSMAATSSAVVLLWGSGKTDLFAVGPAVGACLFGLLSWDRRYRSPVLFMTGIFTGLACVFKLSYLVPLLPGVILVMMWRALFDAFHAVRRQDWKGLWSLCPHAFKEMALFGAGFACAFAPHVIKNLILLDTALGDNKPGAYFTLATTLRIVLSYPFALTYGNYWAQFGTLSPLILAFTPLLAWLIRPAKWRESKLAALGFSTLFGVLLWIAILPSIFMPRYILASLLMCGIPVAAGADMMSRRRGVLCWIIPVAVLVTLLSTPRYTNHRFRVFDTRQTFQYPIGMDEDCLISSPYNDDCEVHTAINAAASSGDRVFLFAYNRFWLRPDLLEAANTQNEYKLLTLSTEDFWAQFQARNFRFILFDTILFNTAAGILASAPEGIILRELERINHVVAYEILYQKK